jgi:glyoxylase-like metal-dependent hydrolase (beta-lactamase superfamily II)
MVSRNSRQILTFGAAAVVALGGFLTFASAQQGGAPTAGQGGGGGRQQGYGPAPAADYRPVVATPVVVHPIKEGVAYWTEGGVGANTGFVIGPTGVVVFDPKETVAAAQEVVADIAKITPKPIEAVIVSHSNPDHSKGLGGYPKTVTIIAQANCAKELEMEGWFMRDQNFPRWTLPKYVVDKRADVKLGGMNVVLLHWAPAHTSGDLMAYFPDLKMAFLGDLMGGNGHIENDGSTKGMIESLKGIVALDADTFVTGHSGLIDKAALQKILADMTERYNKVEEMYKQGKSLDEAEKAMGERVVPRPTDAPPAGLQYFRSFRNMNFTENVYWELAHKS